ncbi:unnamed protein product [Rotaria magnacalcarata]|uniref:Uncharacterized protein n=1 Tax=Rotaria magnacalcarata TaxID=392030 RepID=A0A816ANJ9_9BILA|nr:unnamed protein product [Rotaria magnacalcarata]CAF1599291.1 unnamed protein product [Rotaria magnacalcarata]CAF2045098.1 unnamed protein product [Rotaria magnacalcarata]CAF2125089.1 unnamed protein product [Rotaria magnacalcarata]CAF3752907.1 unnamed protein product [Rotaria magnacalcarata]
MENSAAMNAYTINPLDEESKKATAPPPPMEPILQAAPVPTMGVASNYMPSAYQYYPNQYNPYQYYPNQMYPTINNPNQSYTDVNQPYKNNPNRNLPVANVQQDDIRKINDWLPWSIVSLCVGGLLIGVIPLIFSLVCRSKKEKNDIKGARTMSKLALVFNVIVTVLGIAAAIALVVYLAFFLKRDPYVYYGK